MMCAKETRWVRAAATRRNFFVISMFLLMKLNAASCIASAAYIGSLPRKAIPTRKSSAIVATCTDTEISGTPIVEPEGKSVTAGALAAFVMAAVLCSCSSNPVSTEKKSKFIPGPSLSTVNVPAGFPRITTNGYPTPNVDVKRPLMYGEQIVEPYDQPVTCTKRPPVYGEQVVGNGRMIDKKWVLEEGEIATVFDIDSDGDMRLINPQGEISDWVLRKFYFYKNKVPVVYSVNHRKMNP